ncbi:MAG: VRR-NUC domain-containing protein [Gammaproteobacteria bacterium]|nr:VRR-NUC domain-containing protein [Gammaproteobacteria bacterium]MDE0271070.1 VRR-NUC domain-containing protein [Gammaproteobacteria bacterium]
MSSAAPPVPSLRPGEPPPPDYYRNNLLRLVRFVMAEHADLLMPEDARCLSAILEAGKPAQRLFARLITRKGPLLRLDRINYSEVDDLAQALQALTDAGLVQMNPEAPAQDLLTMLTRAELRNRFETAQGTKPALIEMIIEHCAESCIRAKVMAQTPWLTVACWPSLKLAQLLFFGDGHRDLSVLVLEDLGWRRYEDYRLTPDQRLFRDRDEIDRYLRARLLNEATRSLDQLPGMAGPLSKALAECAVQPSRLEAKTLNRARNRLGRWFERAGEWQSALGCYVASAAHPARERQVRILTRIGDEQAARHLLRRIAQAPLCAEEADFAARFGQRRKRCAPKTTTKALGSVGTDSIERHAMALLATEGGEAWHLENHLPRGLAGLAFWDVVFAPVAGAFLNPYQDAPLDLHWEDFAASRSEAIAAQKRTLANPALFAETLRGTLRRKTGVANRLVSWRHMDGTVLERLLETVPHEVLLGLACRVIDNPGATRTGFPDLLVLYGARDYEFVEVKGPTDSLQPAQRQWFNYLESNGFKARVLKFKA